MLYLGMLLTYLESGHGRIVRKHAVLWLPMKYRGSANRKTRVRLILSELKKLSGTKATIPGIMCGAAVCKLPNTTELH
jgi:hypothetical protein